MPASAVSFGSRAPSLLVPTVRTPLATIGLPYVSEPVLAIQRTFFPVSTSKSVGGFLSGLTMLRCGVRPNIGQSSASARDGCRDKTIAPKVRAAAMREGDSSFVIHIMGEF